MAETALLTPLGWLAAPLFKTLFDKAHHHLGTGIDEKMKILQATVLPRLSLAIERAEKSPNKGKLVDWLKRLKGAYYEAEEAIDLFEYELLKQKGCIDNLIEISKETKEFCDLLEVRENVSRSDYDRDTISEPPNRVFGRERDKENIVDLLIDKPLNSEAGPSTRPAISIIAIMGRSGVGKTALAQYVYKHMDEQKHFDLLVWVHAPGKFKASDVIKIMMENIEPKKDTPTTDESLLKQTSAMLGSKKLLLVLDDFWSDTESFQEQWEKFFKFISSCLPGSKILLTTQSINAAKHAVLAGVTEVKTYYLQEIEEDQFSDLFMHYAWAPNNRNSEKEKFEKIGRKIAVKLKGDPGAAKLVGHELSGKLDLWEKVAEKDWLGDNMKARIWSYQQLPPEHQRCFAICSLFRKGFMFRIKDLIDFWIAEGFIGPSDKEERLEDIGQNYLDELVSRFFFEQVVVNNVIFFQLHDLLHDLAERVQGDDLIRIDSATSRDASNISRKFCRSENIRHISLPSSMINEVIENLCVMKNLCTFRVQSDGGIVPKKVLQEIFRHMEKLRVLVIPDCDEWPDSIGNLKHLRLLSWCGTQHPKKLPDSICKLYHLQNIYLPNIETLPKDFSSLISLRNCYTFGKTMPHISHIGRLTSLQCLGQFVVRKEHGYELHQLENLNQLRGRMCIAGLENVVSTEDAVRTNLRNKEHLLELEFEWNSDKRDIDNITGLSTQHVELLEALQPHPNISSLALIGFGGYRFPNWLLSHNSLRHLTSLLLMNCDKVEEISSIGESLPSCQSLILFGLKNLKKLPSLPPNLTYLYIDHLPQLSYFSEDDLLMKEERKQSKLELVKQVAECLKLKKRVQSTMRLFLQFTKDRLEVSPEICITSSQYGNIFSERVKFDLIGDCSRDQLLDAWVMCMHYHIDKMFNKNEESMLALPSSLTSLEISSCSITSDALSTSIQCLFSLTKLELHDIQTITSLPPKEVLSSLKNLMSFTIKGCYLLSSLGGIGALASLIEFVLHVCPNLSTSNGPLPSSLVRLSFWDCPNVNVILAKSNLPVLRFLSVLVITLKNRPRGVLHVGHLSCLEDLAIDRWDGVLEGLNSLTALRRLILLRCPEIKPSSSMEMHAYALPHVIVDNLLVLNLILSNETISLLEVLTIRSLQGDFSDDEVFQSLTSLRYLSISQCNITHLPKNLKNLASLLYLELDNCPNLYELEELPRNLHQLKITNCPIWKVKFEIFHEVFFHGESIIVTFTTEEQRNRF